jgi:pimeloyl-ACP methyl ester carboxylesterase
MDVATFHSSRRYASTASGRIAYVERGSGPAALFVHGVPLNGFHWRHVIAEMRGRRRCIALDLMGLGYTEIGPTQDVSFTAQARMLGEFLDALGLDQVDLVANDSGGAIAQIFAASHPERLRTLTLTNCDVHDNWPPPAIEGLLDAARKGVLIDAYAKYIDDPQARHTRFSRAYADPGVLTNEVYRVYIDPLRATRESRDNFHRYWHIFFAVKWAHWLKDAIPGAVRVVEVPGAKLFFPEDRPQALLEPLLSFLKG